MKLLTKIAIWFGGFVAAGVLAFIALVIYINYIDVCDPYQTTFLGKTIKFPMKLNEATQYYHLQTDGTVGWSFAERDTLRVIDTYGNSKELNKVVFYLRDLSIEDRGKLRASLEKRYGHKFTFNPVISSLSYMKLADCVFLQVSNFAFPENTLTGIGKKQITCIITFFYHVSENEVSGRSNEGGWSNSLSPDHQPHPKPATSEKQTAAPLPQPVTAIE